MSIKNFKIGAPKIRTPVKPSSSAEEAYDELAVEYLGHKERAKSADAAANAVNDKIKAVAARRGKPEDKSLMCYGRKFVIGFSETKPTDIIDFVLLEKHFTEPQLKKFSTKVRMVDEKALQKFIESNPLMVPAFKKCLKPSPRQPIKRVYVATKQAHMAFKQKKQDANETESD